MRKEECLHIYVGRGGGSWRWSWRCPLAFFYFLYGYPNISYCTETAQICATSTTSAIDGTCCAAHRTIRIPYVAASTASTASLSLIYAGRLAARSRCRSMLADAPDDPVSATGARTSTTMTTTTAWSGGWSGGMTTTTTWSGGWSGGMWRDRLWLTTILSFWLLLCCHITLLSCLDTYGARGLLVLRAGAVMLGAESETSQTVFQRARVVHCRWTKIKQPTIAVCKPLVDSTTIPHVVSASAVVANSRRVIDKAARWRSWPVVRGISSAGSCGGGRGCRRFERCARCRRSFGCGGPGDRHTIRWVRPARPSACRVIRWIRPAHPIGPQEPFSNSLRNGLVAPWPESAVVGPGRGQAAGVGSACGEGGGCCGGGCCGRGRGGSCGSRCLRPLRHDHHPLRPLRRRRPLHPGHHHVSSANRLLSPTPALGPTAPTSRPPRHVRHPTPKVRSRTKVRSRLAPAFRGASLSGARLARAAAPQSDRQRRQRVRTDAGDVLPAADLPRGDPGAALAW